MPRRDGTGPFGMGNMTGRGMGFCVAPRRGLGGYYGSPFSAVNDKDMLKQEKELLERRMNAINKELENQD